MSRSADVRYLGQGYELRADVRAGSLDEAAIERFWTAFHERHQLEYGHSFPERPIEIVNIRVVGVAAMPKIGAPVLSLCTDWTTWPGTRPTGVEEWHTMQDPNWRLKRGRAARDWLNV